MGLEQHVAELGVADPVVPLHAGPDAVLGHHHVDREVLADVAEEVEVAHACGPGGVVDHPGRVHRRVEVEEPRELALDAGEVLVQLLPGEEVALGGLARGVADHAGGAPGQGDRVVAVQLEAAQRQLADQVPTWSESPVGSKPQ
jgi:hypothetical protein